MNQISKLNLKKNNNSSLFFVVLVAFLSSVTAFGQTENSVGVSTELVIINPDNVVIDNPVKASKSGVNSNVNFILWFMGTKGDMGETFSTGDYSKKSLMTSGRQPNRLLVKTLLKKAVNIKSC